jgi:hypothetical protein
MCFDQQSTSGLVVFTNSDNGWRLYLDVASELFPGAKFLDWLGAFYGWSRNA